MESSSSRCHLLRVSREIRFLVYDLVIHVDLPSDVIWNCKDGFGKEGFFTQISNTSDQNFSIPWVNLLSTCKAIGAEVSAYMDSQSFLKEEQNRSWVVDLAAAHPSRIGPTRWRRIPCHPAKIETLVANIDFGTNVRFWGCGDRCRMCGNSIRR